eukprot:1158187-Pelagomonas_calceolata.AAC.4
MTFLCYKDPNITQFGAVGGQIWSFGVETRVHATADLACFSLPAVFKPSAIEGCQRNPYLKTARYGTAMQWSMQKHLILGLRQPPLAFFAGGA